jgi:putative DNA primase/helicase
LNLENTWLGREDRHLERKLRAELPGILLWAIEGWKRLNARGHFEQPQTGKALLQEIEDLSNPLGAFVRQVCELHEGVVPFGSENEWFTSNEEIFTAWRKWCESEGRQAIGEKSTMIRNLRGNYPALRSVRILRELNNRRLRPRGLLGIRVRYDDDAAEGPAQQSLVDEF